MNVHERVKQGKHVRVRPLADAIGANPSTVYGWIRDGRLEAVEFAGIVTIPAHAAARVLGLVDSTAPQSQRAA